MSENQTTDQTTPFTIRLSESLKQSIEQKAARLGIKPAPFTAELLRKALEAYVHTTEADVHTASQTLREVRVGDRLKLRYQPAPLALVEDIWEVTAVQGETIQVRLQHSLQPSQETSLANVERVI